MSAQQTQVIHLNTMPSAAGLMLKVAFNKKTAPSQVPLLPKDVYCIAPVKIEKSMSDKFHDTVAWQKHNKLCHPCFLHRLAFPLHLKLLLLHDFPFTILGLVHIENQIRQFRVIQVGEIVSISARFGQVVEHGKGWLFDIEVDVYVDSELVWQSISRNLYRMARPLRATSQPEPEAKITPPEIRLDWKLGSDLGRQYARSSGDYNPIHLAKGLARLFGFKQHIVHGMWTKSKAISELYAHHDLLFESAFEINTQFKQPLYLPSDANMLIYKNSQVEPDLTFIVQSHNGSDHLHLTGSIGLL
jgi:hypothetical protein